MVKCIMISGPQMKTVALAGSIRAWGMSVVTTPTRPRQPGPARSTDTSTLTSKRPRQVSMSFWNSTSSGVRAPNSRQTWPNCSRWRSRWWTTGRSGASPMPPATSSTSRPFAASTGQGVPNGPRRPTSSPRLRPCSSLVTRPTARTVCTTCRVSAASPLIEMAASPTPGR